VRASRSRWRERSYPIGKVVVVTQMDNVDDQARVFSKYTPYLLCNLGPLLSCAVPAAGVPETRACLHLNQDDGSLDASGAWPTRVR